MEDVGGPSRPSSPAIRNGKHPISRPSTPAFSGGHPSHSQSAHALHPKNPIQTPQQFYDWFALIDRSVAHSQEAHFREHLTTVAEHLESCDQLLQRIDQVDSELEGMLGGWKSVEEGGKSLKDACEELLEERVRVLCRGLSTSLLNLLHSFRTTY